MAPRPPFIEVPTLKLKQLYIMRVPNSRQNHMTWVMENEFGQQTVIFGDATRTVEAMVSIGATFDPVHPVSVTLRNAIAQCADIAAASNDKNSQAAASAVKKWLDKIREPDSPA